jgi:hypothetical protein
MTAQAADVDTVIDHRRAERWLVATVAAPALLLAAAAGLLAAYLSATGHSSVIVLVIGAVLLVWALVKYAEAGVLLVVLTATLIEQFAISYGSSVSVGVWTSTLGFFASFNAAAGLSGLGVSPAELLMAVVLVAWVTRAALDHTLHVPHSWLGRSVAVLTAVVVVGFAVGMLHGGDQHAALGEVRPWVYLAALYLVGSQVLASRRALNALLWTLVLGTGAKALQGVYLTMKVRSLEPRPEAVLSHEESVFFALFAAITLCLWLFGISGRLRTVATCLLPFVILADVGNHRRAAWLIAGAAVAAALTVTAVRVPRRRRMIGGLCAALLIGGVIYLPMFWNNDGNFGQPARAVRSLISPDPRDQGSDQYRQVEDANLGINIKEWTPFGAGFGVPIDYRIPIVDISGTDSLIKYVPHDGVLYVWMRLGWQGMLAFFALLASAIFAACRLTAARDPLLRLVGTVGITAVFAYLIMGYTDLGLYWFRVAIVMGVVLGAVEAGIQLARREGDPLAEKSPQVTLRCVRVQTAVLPGGDQATGLRRPG